MNRVAVLSALLACALAGCGSGAAVQGSPDLAPGDFAAPPDLAPASDLLRSPDLLPMPRPITAPHGVWTWVPVEGAVCDDGTPTGVGVYLTDSDKLLIFLNGGGACWDYLTCFVLNTSSHGPYGAPQFAQLVGAMGNGAGTILSDENGATFKGWNKVFVPYCTGDVHAGDAVQTYSAQGQMGVIHHEGYVNVGLAVARLALTLPSIKTLVLSGSSAGGFGATLNYARTRTVWPQARGYLIDDSGPLFVGSGISDFLRGAWTASWNLSATALGYCPECQAGDWSLAYSNLATRFPQDRMALLSSERDSVISQYLLLSDVAFEADLNQLAAERFDSSQRLRYFFQAGTTHTMLGDEPAHTTSGIHVATWIDGMVNDAPSWDSVKP